MNSEDIDMSWADIQRATWKSSILRSFLGSEVFELGFWAKKRRWWQEKCRGLKWRGTSFYRTRWVERPLLKNYITSPSWQDHSCNCRYHLQRRGQLLVQEQGDCPFPWVWQWNSLQQWCPNRKVDRYQKTHRKNPSFEYWWNNPSNMSSKHRQCLGQAVMIMTVLRVSTARGLIDTKSSNRTLPAVSRVVSALLVLLLWKTDCWLFFFSKTGMVWNMVENHQSECLSSSFWDWQENQ